MHYKYDFTNRKKPGSYWFEEERLSFCQVLSSRMADLLDVVMAIYAADRQSRREFNEANTGHRRIHIRIGVRNPQIWTESEIEKGLITLLNWLSEDIWSFEFFKRQEAPTAAELKCFLFQFLPEPPVTVSLFSGGLDSFAGLAKHAQTFPGRSYVLVSGYTQNRLASLQRIQVKRIRSAWREELWGSKPTIGHVTVPFGLHKIKQLQEEKGQRTRALAFLAFGTVAALQVYADTLWVFENGVGAMNLPLNETQLGVDSYRGVHPLSLMTAENLFGSVLERPINIKNPFLFHTKAELCKSLKHAGLADAVQHTVSCDSFPLRIPGKPSQCGFCTSCVLRRQSLLTAGFQECDSRHTYLCDVMSNGASIAPERLYGIEVMRGQVYKLSRCLDSNDPWQSLIESFPDLLKTHAELVKRKNLNAEETCARFVQLYRTYVREWKSLPGTC